MKPLYNHSRIKERRRRLRRDQTYAEKMLWEQLRGHRLDGYKFYRQYSVGAFILDFYSVAAKLAIELDGPEHAEGDAPEYDARRTSYLESLGIHVLRFRNEELLAEPNRVVALIKAAVRSRARR